MTSNKLTSIIAGSLIIIGMCVGMISIVPSVENTDYIEIKNSYIGEYFVN